MTRDPEAALANAELDVVAPIGRDVQACCNEADAEADHQEHLDKVLQKHSAGGGGSHQPGLHGVVELVPGHRVGGGMRGGNGWHT